MLLLLVWKQKPMETESNFNSVVCIHVNPCIHIITYTTTTAFFTFLWCIWYWPLSEMRSWPWTSGHIHIHVENKIEFPGLSLFLMLDDSGVSLWQQWTHPSIKLQRTKWNQTVVLSVGMSSLFSLEIRLAWESGPPGMNLSTHSQDKIMWWFLIFIPCIKFWYWANGSLRKFWSIVKWLYHITRIIKERSRREIVYDYFILIFSEIMDEAFSYLTVDIIKVCKPQ